MPKSLSAKSRADKIFEFANASLEATKAVGGALLAAAILAGPLSAGAAIVGFAFLMDKFDPQPGAHEYQLVAGLSSKDVNAIKDGKCATVFLQSNLANKRSNDQWYDSAIICGEATESMATASDIASTTQARDVNLTAQASEALQQGNCVDAVKHVEGSFKGHPVIESERFALCAQRPDGSTPTGVCLPGDTSSLCRPRG